MPRLTDHTQRRRQLADAALAAAGDGGLDAVTIARVARLAGVSVGHVQHYFSTKEELMVQAYTTTLDRLLDRVASGVERREQAGGSIRDMMIAGLTELLPTDDERRVEAMVRAQFHGRAAADPRLAAVGQRTGEEVRAQVSRAVVNGRICEETAADADPSMVAWRVWALAEGLATSMLHRADVPAGALLRDTVTAVFPHPCRRHEGAVPIGQ